MQFDHSFANVIMVVVHVAGGIIAGKQSQYI